MNGVTHLPSGKRDTAVDLLRAMALLMMVSVHFARVIPDSSRAAEVFKFFFGGAPAFFFFVFGMTLPRFFTKSGAVQFRSIKIFLIIAILQTFMMEAPFSIDFFLFLWFWQVFLTLLDRVCRAFIPGITAGFGLFFAALLLLPPEWMSRSFAPWGGYFPLMPWGLFVLAGLLFSKTIQGPRVIAGSASMVGIALLMHTIGLRFGIEGLIAEKIPMTAVYFLLFCGLVIGVHWFAKAGARRIEERPRVLNFIRFLSINLLLGTVLHYFAFRLMKGAVLAFRMASPKEWGTLERQWDFWIMAGGSLAACLILWALMKMALAAHARCKATGISSFLRRRLGGIGLGSVVLTTALFYAGVRIRSGRPFFGISLEGVWASAPIHGVKILALLFMVYLCLEMKNQPNASTGTGRP